MWGRNRLENNGVAGDSMTLISAGTEIQGDVAFTGSMHVEGKICGNLKADQGVITITQSGSVEGDIRAPRIVINGSVRGNVYAGEHLELAAQAVINGNVYYNVVEMVKGSQVNGCLEHRSENRPEVTPLLEKVNNDGQNDLIEAEQE